MVVLSRCSLRFKNIKYSGRENKTAGGGNFGNLGSKKYNFVKENINFVTWISKKIPCGAILNLPPVDSYLHF